MGTVESRELIADRKQFDVDGVPSVVEVFDTGVGRRRKRGSITQAGLDAYFRTYEGTVREAQGFLLIFS